jgi:hypothetical protein
LSESAGPARRPPIPIAGPTGAADAPPASRSDRVLLHAKGAVSSRQLARSACAGRDGDHRRRHPASQRPELTTGPLAPDVLSAAIGCRRGTTGRGGRRANRPSTKSRAHAAIRSCTPSRTAAAAGCSRSHRCQVRPPQTPVVDMLSASSARLIPRGIGALRSADRAHVPRDTAQPAAASSASVGRRSQAVHHAHRRQCLHDERGEFVGVDRLHAHVGRQP